MRCILLGRGAKVFGAKSIKNGFFALQFAAVAGVWHKLHGQSLPLKSDAGKSF